MEKANEDAGGFRACAGLRGRGMAGHQGAVGPRTPRAATLGALGCLAVVCAAPAVSAEARDPVGPPSVAVFPLEAATGVSEPTARVVTDALVEQVRDAKAFSKVVSAKEIETLVAFERQRQMMDCNDTSCMTEIAGALGVDFILVGSVAHLGDSFILNAKLLSCRTATTAASDSRRMKGENEETLLDAIAPTVRKLMDDAGLARVDPPVSAPSVAVASHPAPEAPRPAPAAPTAAPTTAQDRAGSSPPRLPLLAGGAVAGVAAVASAVATVALAVGVGLLQVAWRMPTPDSPLRDVAYVQRLQVVYGGSAVLGLGALVGAVAAAGLAAAAAAAVAGGFLFVD